MSFQTVKVCAGAGYGSIGAQRRAARPGGAPLARTRAPTTRLATADVRSAPRMAQAARNLLGRLPTALSRPAKKEAMLR